MKSDPENHPGNRPLITFALFAYNQERFVREAVEGAFSQTYSPLEIILSDDCSSDRTFEIIQEMAAGYRGPHEIILNRNPKNLCIGGHINKIMELAKGELIVGAAGDDVSLPHRVAALVNAWQTQGKPPALCSQAICMSESGDPFSQRFLGYDGHYPATNEPKETTLLRLVSKNECILHGCTEAWSPLLFRVFGPLHNNVVHEDNALSFRAWLLGDINFSSQALVCYRMHENNISFSRPRYYRTRQELMEYERCKSRAARRWCSHIKQHLEDLVTAKRLSMLSDSLLQQIKATLEAKLIIKEIHASWWEAALSKQLKCAGRFALHGDFVELGWALPRLLPLSLYVRARHVVGIISRGLRKAGLRR